VVTCHFATQRVVETGLAASNEDLGWRIVSRVRRDITPGRVHLRILPGKRGKVGKPPAEFVDEHGVPTPDDMSDRSFQGKQCPNCFDLFRSSRFEPVGYVQFVLDIEDQFFQSRHGTDTVVEFGEAEITPDAPGSVIISP